MNKGERSASQFRKSQINKFAGFLDLRTFQPFANAAIFGFAICRPYIFAICGFDICGHNIFADLKLPQIHNFYPLKYIKMLSFKLKDEFWLLVSFELHVIW